MRIISMDTLFSEFESNEFYLRFSSLIKSISSFLIFLESHPSIDQFINIVSTDSNKINIIKKRIKKMLNYKCNKNELHPYDHSIAIYLYVIFVAFANEVKPILDFVYKEKIGNLYWTYIIYNYILKNLPDESNEFCATYQITVPKEKDFDYFETSD